MNRARWFVAHTRKTEDAQIDDWCNHLTVRLSTPEWDAEVVSGRDDFRHRAGALGGWQQWCRDVPSGCRYDGEPFFHGVIIPSRALTVGKATAQMVRGFIREGKHAFVWDPLDDTFRGVARVSELPGDNWITWGQLVLEE